MAKIIVHIDLNAFFASAEVVRNPSLAGKPLIVGHAGRSGIVSTCSYEARKYGIHSGQPTFQAQKLCPSVIILPPDFDYYSALSRSFFALVSEVSPLIEKASIDECYADFTKPLLEVEDPVGFLRDFQKKLKEQTGIGCSIGVATNRWLAKMGSDMKKPMGLTIIHKSDIEKLIYPLPIESFWGIGKKTAPFLRSIGIATIGDFAKRAKEDDPVLQKSLGKFFLTAKAWALGEGSDEIDMEPWDPKSVGVSETLFFDACGYEQIEPTLRAICKEVASRARREKKAGKNIVLQVKDTAFQTHSKSVTIERATQDEAVIFARASELYKQHYEAMEVRLIGVTLKRLVDPRRESVQLSLFEEETFSKEDETRLLLSKLNHKLGKGSLFLGSDIKGKQK